MTFQVTPQLGLPTWYDRQQMQYIMREVALECLQDCKLQAEFARYAQTHQLNLNHNPGRCTTLPFKTMWQPFPFLRRICLCTRASTVPDCLVSANLAEPILMVPDKGSPDNIQAASSGLCLGPAYMHEALLHSTMLVCLYPFQFSRTLSSF